MAQSNFFFLQNRNIYAYLFQKKYKFLNQKNKILIFVYFEALFDHK